MSTFHIQAAAGEFAETVLMPGDPLRAKMIADTWLTDVRQVNGIRNMLGYTGRYNDQLISVMGSGMGIPSISIYAQELFDSYAVQRIVRVGSCGSVQPTVRIGDLVIALGASTDSVVNRKRFAGFDFAALADYRLLERTVRTADDLGLAVHVGNVFSADLFYEPDTTLFARMTGMGILAVEMEAAGLYGLAAQKGRQALTILTVSDHILEGQGMSADERQNGFHDMLHLTLEAMTKP